MADFLDNLVLGAAGVEDLVAHAVGIDTTAAADVYADQTAQEQGLDDAQAQQLQQTAETAETTQGVVEQSARKTVDDVAKKVSNGTSWLLIGAGVVVLAVLAIKLA